MNASREVVITGLGVVSPIAIGQEAFWQALVAGKSGVKVRERFADFETAHRIAAPVEGFEAKKFVKPRKALKIMCGPIQFGCAAAAMAVEHAQLDTETVSSDRMGTVFGTETFFADPKEVADVFQKCTENKNYQHERWGEFAMREIQPLWMLKYLPNMAASHISIATDARGPSNSICQGEASGSLALIEAASLIQRGVVDVVIAGGTGAQMALTATLYRGTDMLSKRIHEPALASRPFDQDRDGMVVGEGAGAVVLESAEHAKQRGASPIVRIAGWSRGYHAVGQPGMSDALRYHYQESVRRSGLETSQINLINANASGSQQLDAIEAQAINGVFDRCPVVAHKSNFGNIGPGTSIVELLGAIQSIQHNQMVPTRNCQQVATDCPIEVVRDENLEQCHASVNHQIQRVLKSSFSSTGQITSVVIEAANS